MQQLRALKSLVHIRELHVPNARFRVERLQQSSSDITPWRACPESGTSSHESANNDYPRSFHHHIKSRQSCHSCRTRVYEDQDPTAGRSAVESHSENSSHPYSSSRPEARIERRSRECYQDDDLYDGWNVLCTPGESHGWSFASD